MNNEWINDNDNEWINEWMNESMIWWWMNK